MIKNNFRILKKQYAYLQTILKTPVKFQKDWPKTVGGVADTRMVVGADGRTDGRTDGQTDRRTDGRTLKISEGITLYPATFWWRGIIKKGSDQKQPRKGEDTIFPIITQWGLSVALDTRVLIQSASKHYAAFPLPQ